MMTRLASPGSCSGGRGKGLSGYATSTVLVWRQRGPIRRPLTSVFGPPSTRTVIQISASVGLMVWSCTSIQSMFAIIRQYHSPGDGGLQDQHRVAVAVEAVALLDSRIIRPPNQLNAREGTHQHQQAAPRQV